MKDKITTLNKVAAKITTELIDMEASYMLSELQENWLDLAHTHVVTQ